MKLIWKIVIALAVVLFSPALITLVVIQRWDADTLSMGGIVAIYLVLILLVSLGVRWAFRTKKVAIGIYVAGMGLLFALAIAALGSELHGAVFSYVCIPAIAISFPIGLRVIGDEKIQTKNAGAGIAIMGFTVVVLGFIFMGGGDVGISLPFLAAGLGSIVLGIAAVRKAASLSETTGAQPPA